MSPGEFFGCNRWKGIGLFPFSSWLLIVPRLLGYALRPTQMFYPLNLYDAASKESKVSSDLRIARAKKNTDMGFGGRSSW